MSVRGLAIHWYFFHAQSLVLGGPIARAKLSMQFCVWFYDLTNFAKEACFVHCEPTIDDKPD